MIASRSDAATFGRDLANGELVEAKSRLMICGDVTNEKAVELYKIFQKQNS
jgi:hypothetical protein